MQLLISLLNRQNNWRERADFQQAHDRYFYIPATHEIEDDNAPKAGDNDDDDSSEKGVDPACNLPGSVQSLLHLISNRKEFMHTYAAYGLRTAGLGSLTSGQIRNGFKLLKIISGIITFIDKKNGKGQPVPSRFRYCLYRKTFLFSLYIYISIFLHSFSS